MWEIVKDSISDEEDNTTAMAKCSRSIGMALVCAIALDFTIPKISRAVLSDSNDVMQVENLKHVNAGVLNVAYYETGPSAGPPVILLHGYPYGIHSFSEVASILAADG